MPFPQVYSGRHGRTMIFTQTKADANELALNSHLKTDCRVLHGDIAQKQRELTLKVGEGGREGGVGGGERGGGGGNKGVWC